MLGEEEVMLAERRRHCKLRKNKKEGESPATRKRDEKMKLVAVAIRLSGKSSSM